ncbi:hypothetical protein ABGV42_01605 [Paenibacillus pabuli]|uniref:hypothetical protein n=1 Tax=Paenibacillus pabuli TaxID=1472 RepID=UPI003242BF1D
MNILVINHYNRAVIIPDNILESAINAFASTMFLEHIVTLDESELESYANYSGRNILTHEDFASIIYGNLTATVNYINSGLLVQGEYELYVQKSQDLETIYAAMVGNRIEANSAQMYRYITYVFANGELEASDNLVV